MTNQSVLLRILLLSLTFFGALCSKLMLMPHVSEIVQEVGGDGFVVTCLGNQPHKEHGLHWKNSKGVISSRQQHRVHVRETQIGNITGLTLIFRTIEPSDAEMYFCENAHGGSSEQVSFKLSIYERMTFKDTPLEQNFSDGDAKIMVRCEASGAPTPVIKWSGFLPSPKYQTVADGLVISNVTPDDAGLYKCMALQAGYGEIVTANIRVNVLHIEKVATAILTDVNFTPCSYGFFLDKPRWNSTTVPSVLFRTKNKRAVLQCAASAYPQPVYRWFFRDTKLESNASQVVAHEDGIYRCEVANSQGAIARNFTVFEGFLPDRPDKPKAHNITLNTVTLDFTPPKPSKHHNITGYNIELRDKNSNYQKRVKLSEAPPFVIKDLRPDTTYVIRLKAENELGYGDYSLEFEAKTSAASLMYNLSFVSILWSITFLCFF